MSSEGTKLAEIWLARFGTVVYKEDKPMWEPMKRAILENLSSPEGLRPLDMYGPAIVFPVITASALAGAQYREFAIATCRVVGEQAVPPLIQLLDSIESYHEAFTSVYMRCGYHQVGAERDASFAIGTALVIALEALIEIVCIHTEVAIQYPALGPIGERYGQATYSDRVKWSARGLRHAFRLALDPTKIFDP